MTIAKDFAAKAFVAFVAAAMMISLFAPAAKAQTAEELQTQINDLMAQIATLQAQVGQGGTSASGVCPYTWTRDLNMGATGADVMKLQQFLNANADTRVSVSGAGSVGAETEYYGALTGAAVAKFQVMYRAEILTPLGMVNPSTYFGPSTRAKANSVCVTAPVIDPVDPGTPTPTPIGELEGGAGSINEAQFISAINNEEVGEGQNDVDVSGLNIKPENSDIALTAVKLTFDHSQGTEESGSATRLDKYADEVSLWLDGEEIARVDAGDFTKDTTGVYYKTISVADNAIIRDGEFGKLVVSVSGISNLDSTDVAEEWGVRVDNVRYKDAQGAIITDSSTPDINIHRVFSFESFATSADMNFKVSSDDTSINTARTIEVSSTTKMNDIEVLSFSAEIEGNSDMWLDELTVDATTTNTILTGVVSTAYLVMDGDIVGSENITSTMATAGEFQFNDLDLNLTAGKTYSFVVTVDFLEATGAFLTGTTINVDVSSADVDDTAKWVLEDENADTVSAADRSGSASADAHTLVTAGVNITLGDTTQVEVVDANSTAANYAKITMPVEIFAIGDTIYVLETAASSPVALTTSDLHYVFEDTSGAQIATASSTTGSFSLKSGGTVDGSSIRIDDGQTAIFEFVGTFDPTTAAQMRARVVGVGFGTTNSGTGSSQTASPASSYRSGNVFIND